MARPNLGVRVPLLCRPPGIGGRSKGAGEDILGDGEAVESILVLENFTKSVRCPPAKLKPKQT